MGPIYDIAERCEIFLRDTKIEILKCFFNDFRKKKENIETI